MDAAPRSRYASRHTVPPVAVNDHGGPFATAEDVALGADSFQKLAAP
jgi:hypothetical protein